MLTLSNPAQTDPSLSMSAGGQALRWTSASYAAVSDEDASYEEAPASELSAGDDEAPPESTRRRTAASPVGYDTSAGLAPELIAGVARSVPEAQQALAQLVYGRVRRLARSLCKSQADADDVTQQVLLEILRDASSFRFEGSFERWVDRITHRRALRTAKLDRHRRNMLSEWLVPGTLPWGAHGQVPPTGTSNLQAALNLLRPHHREVLVLHHGYGYSVREITKLLNAPPGTVKDRLVAGKKQLRRVLQDELRYRGWLKKRSA